MQPAAYRGSSEPPSTLGWSPMHGGPTAATESEHGAIHCHAIHEYNIYSERMTWLSRRRDRSVRDGSSLQWRSILYEEGQAQGIVSDPSHIIVLYVLGGTEYHPIPCRSLSLCVSSHPSESDRVSPPLASWYLQSVIEPSCRGTHNCSQCDLCLVYHIALPAFLL